METTLLIFGITGQDGQYLSRLAKMEHCKVVGVSRSSGVTAGGSVADYLFVSSYIKQYSPQYIFHFAAESTTRHDALFSNNDAISIGTLNILEATRLYAPSAKVFLSGSAMQFLNTGDPIKESTPFAATSPYAAARIYATYLGRYFRSTFGLQIYTGFFFNHDSPLRTERHVNQKIASAARRIAAGSKERLVLGDITVKKEFNFAGDIIAAVWQMVNQNDLFEAVVGSGEAHSIEEWVDCCFREKGLSWRDHVDLDERYQPEYKSLVSSPELLFSIGWRPKMNFAELATLMLAGERE